MNISQNHKKRFARVVALTLVFTNLFFGMPVDFLLEKAESFLHDRNVVDVLYLATKSGKVADSLANAQLPRSVKQAHALTTTYDFASCAGSSNCDTSTSWWASDDDVDVFPFANNSANRNNHTENLDADYTALSASDDSRFASANPGTGDEIFNWFEMDITEDPATIAQIDFTYEGFTTSTANFSILVKDDTTAFQNNVAWTQVGAVQSITASTETSFTRSLSGVDFANYIDANGIITWAVYESVSAVVVSTDYVKMDVITHTVEQEGYRFRNDDGSESAATWLQTQDTNITQPNQTTTRLRTILNDTAGGNQATTQYQLEYKLSSDTRYRPVQSMTSAIAYSANGTSSGGDTTLVTVTAPATVDRGDLLVLGISNKYPTNGPTTPAGWTAITNYQASGGAGSAGIDTGNVYATAFVKEAEGWEDGIPVYIDIASGNSAEAQIIRFIKGTGKEWDLAATTGSDTSQDTTYSATGAGDPGITAGDIVVTVTGSNSDAAGWSAHALTATGISGVSSTERNETAGAGGDDTELVMVTHGIGTGTASTAPTYTSTATANVAGATVFLRIREVDAAIQLSASSNITASGENTTAQLTAPAGGPTFTAGRIQDDENPADTVDINDSQYTEMEWSVIADDTTADSEVYQFRVTANGQPLTTYTATPQWTIGGSAVYNQPHFRIRSGDTVGLNTDSGWAAALDTNATMDAGSVFRVRFEVEETAGTGVSKTFMLQYRYKPVGGSYGSWASAPDIGVADEDGPIQILASSQYADGDAASTNLLSGSAETFDAGGTGEENRTTGALTISNEHAEYEFAMMIRGTYGGPTKVKDGDVIDLRIVESSGTVLNGSYTNPVITVNIPDYYIGAPMPETPSRVGPIADSNGNLYYFASPTEITGTGNNEPEMMKSSDGGVTWDFVDTAGSPTSNTVEAADVFQYGDQLYICQQQSSTDHPVVMHVFNTSDHPTSPDSWETIDESVDTTANGTDEACGIVVRSNRSVVVVYFSTDGTNDQVSYNVRNAAGNWSGEQDVDTTASVDFVFSGMVLGKNDKLHIFYKDDTNNDLFHKSLNLIGTLSSRTTVELDADASDDDWSTTMPVYWDDNGTEKIMTLIHDDSDSNMYSVVITDDGTPETRKQVSDGSVSLSPIGTTSEQPVADLAIDPDTDTAYALFSRSTTGDLDLDKAQNDGGWGTDTTLVTATDIVYVRGTVFTQNAANGGEKVYGYIYEDSSGGEAGYSRYGQTVMNASQSFQRKTWWDGTRYWRAYHDTTDGRIEFEYSTDGTSWTENTSARITTGATNDFSVEADSSNAFVTYSTGGVTDMGTAVSSTSLAGHWKLNEDSWAGTTNEVADSSGNAMHGTRSGNATTLGDGRLGRGGLFDGTGDYVSVSDHATLDITGDLTLSAWVYRTGGTNQYVISKTNDSSDGGYALLIGSSGEVYCRTVNGSGHNDSYTPTGLVTSDSTWHHLAAVRNGTSCEVWVDGVKRTATRATHTTLTANTNILAIGSQPSGGNYMLGRIDDARVYSRALTDAEISILAKPGYDILGAKASSYPGTGFSWGSTETVLNGSSPDDAYDRPVIDRDSSSYVFVGSRYTGTNYLTYPRMIKEDDGTNDLPEDSADSVRSLADATHTGTNTYANVVPLTSQDMYAPYVQAGRLDGCVWDNSDDQWEATSGTTCEFMSDYNFRDGLKAYWKFDETSYSGATGEVKDETNNGNHGARSGNVTSYAQGFYRAPLFDQADDYIVVPDYGTGSNLDAANGSTITIAAWIYPGSLPGADTWQTIVTKGGVDADGDVNYMMQIGNTGGNDTVTFCFTVSDVYQCWDGTGMDLVQSEWQHIAVKFTYGTSSSIRVYHNGTEYTSGSWGGTGQASAPDVSDENLWIGANWSTTPVEEFNGLIDEMRIYDYGLTAAKIASLADYMPMNPDGGPSGYWALNEGSGSLATDASANMNDSRTQTAPYTSSGKYRSGLSMTNNASVEEFEIPAPAAGELDVTAAEDFTISAWIKATDFSESPNIVSKSTGGARYRLYATENANNHTITCEVNDGTNTDTASYNSTTALIDGNWHHIICALDRDGTQFQGVPALALIVDGVTAGADTSLAATGSLSNSAAFQVGELSASGEFDGGGIDEVYFFNRALSGAEMLGLFNGRPSGESDSIDSVPSNVYDSMSAVSDGSGNVYVSYIDDESTDKVSMKKYNGSYWGPVMQVADAADANDSYTTLSYDSTNSDLYGFWIDRSTSDIYYKKADYLSAGRSLDFDGTADYVNIPYAASLDVATDLTIEFWFSPDVSIEASTPQYLGIMSKASSNTDSENDWVFFWEQGENGRMRFGAYGDNVQTTTDTWLAGRWYHIAVTVNASNTALIYVNGVQDNYSGDTSISGNPINGTTNTPLTIGLAQIASGDEYFDGKIDEVRIYGAVRTQAEIQQDMFTSLTGSETNLIGYWNMDEGTGQTVGDLDANNNDGTLGADGSASTDDPTWSTTLPFTHSLDAAETQWKTTGSNVSVASVYAEAAKIFAQWFDGNTIMWDDLTISGGNTAPGAPTTLYTNEGATTAQSGVANPVAVGDGTPNFSAVYNDSDVGDIANKYEVIVYSDSSCTAQVWDSGAAGTSMTNCTQGNRCGDITFGGTSLSLDGRTYYWKVKYWDDTGDAGSFSSCTSDTFTMLGPDGQLRHGNYFFNRQTERVYTW